MPAYAKVADNIALLKSLLKKKLFKEAFKPL
jgi:hypothetical protein